MSDKPESMTYAGSGVDYKGLDAFKRHAQEAARETAIHLKRLGGYEIPRSRGESAFLYCEGAYQHMFAHVHEGLGTKNLVADAMYDLTGESAYEKIAQDTVAMILNDLATVGALPLTCTMHLAVGDGSWFDLPHARALVYGWKKACDIGRVTWGGGETPTLKGIVDPRTAEISGSATGKVLNNKPLLGEQVREGDVIVLVASSGVHANGLTLARKIAAKLPDGYLTKISDGRPYGAALLDPTVIYSALVEDCLKEELDLHYAVHISGHGWRKLMRAPQPFRYVVNTLPVPQPVFGFIQENGPVEEREMYGNYNMGAGFAIYVPLHVAACVIEIAKSLGFTAWVAGSIEAAEKSSVVLVEKNMVFHAEELEVR